MLKIEDDLRKKMAEADIIDLDGKKKTYAAEINQIDAEIMTLSDELALHQALMNRFKNDTKEASPGETNSATAVALTNAATLAADAATNAVQPVPQETIDEYNQTLSYIDDENKQLMEYRKQGVFPAQFNHSRKPRT